MKKQFIFLLILAVMFTNLSFSYADKDLELKAESAILIDSENGDILYDKNSNKQMFPASTTKILTAIIAIENIDLEKKITIDEEVANSADGTHIALEPGEILSMNDLLHALLVQSANDSAMAIAKAVSGTVEEFSKLMNTEAVRMGAKNSSFKNPNGLPDENHLSTAYDLAMISKYAMQNEVFREIVKKPTYTIEPTNKKSEARQLKNSNKMLYSENQIEVDGISVPIKYEGIAGIKTGYTKVAGQCLVAGAKKSDGDFISVVLKSEGTDIYTDTHKLLNYATKNTRIVLAKRNEFIDNIDISGGSPSALTALFKTDFALTETGVDLNKIKREFIVDSNLKLPIKKGQVVGKVNFKNKDELLGSVDIVSGTQVAISTKSFSSLFDNILSKWWFWLIISLVVLRVTIAIRNVAFRAKRLRDIKRQRSKKFRKKGQTD